VVKAVVLWEQAPDSEWYARHAEVCKKVPGGVFRHGKIFGSPMGHEPPYRYYAEWEFPNRDAFETALRTEEFAATGKDAREMGIPVKVMFAEIE